MSDWLRIRVNRSILPQETQGESYHTHPHNELLLVMSGDLVALTPDSYLSHRGACLLLYRAGRLHNQLNRAGTIYQRFYLDFYSDYIGIPASARPMFAADLADNALLIPLSMRRAQQLGSAARIIQELAESKGEPGRDERVQLLVGYILSEAARQYARHASPPRVREADYLSEVTMYISNHLAEKLTISRLAAEFRVGHTKLSADFSTYLAMSVNQYITAERIERARQLLRRGESVDSVSEQCGFSDSGYFIRVFRRYEQMTPLQYKRKAKE